MSFDFNTEMGGEYFGIRNLTRLVVVGTIEHCIVCALISLSYLSLVVI